MMGIMATRDALLAAIALGAAGGCASLLSLDDLSQGSEGGAGGVGSSVGGSATGASGVGGAGTGVGGGMGGTGGCPGATVDCGSGCVDLLTADANCGFCDHSCDGGGRCVNGMCPSIELASAAFIQDIAVDDSHVYWEPGSTNPREILRTPKAGGPPEVVLSPTAVNGDLLLVDDYVVFVNVGFANFRRVLKTGGSAQDVTGQSSSGIADVEARGDTLYFTRFTGGVWRTNALGCCASTEIDPLASPSLLTMGASFAYVLTTSPQPFDVLQRVALPAGGASDFTDALSDEADAMIAIASDDEHVYWSVPDGIHRKKKLGAARVAEELTDMVDVAPTEIVVDPGTGGFVYFIDELSERLVRLPKTGGVPEAITVVPAGTGTELAQDASALYFLRDQTSVHRVGKPPP